MSTDQRRKKQEYKHKIARPRKVLPPLVVEEKVVMLTNGVVIIEGVDLLVSSSDFVTDVFCDSVSFTEDVTLSVTTDFLSAVELKSADVIGNDSVVVLFGVF